VFLLSVRALQKVAKVKFSQKYLNKNYATLGEWADQRGEKKGSTDVRVIVVY
jgi:hypothetical protein